MNPLPRRTISELRARYTFHPELDDVYVEGAFDRDVLSALFSKNKQDDRLAYLIDSVDINAEQCFVHGFSEGCKQRVIVLARELSSLSSGSYRCVVDKDLDHWLGVLEATPRLVWTDYCSLELYYLSDEYMRHLLVTTAKTHIKEWSAFRSSFVDVLRQLFAFRIAAHELGFKFSWMDPSKCLDINGDQVMFAQEEYAKRLLLKNASIGSLDLFLSSVSNWLAKFTDDPRMYIRGHDFVSLLAWSIKKYKGSRAMDSEEAIERMFVLTAEQASNMLIALA